jgi:hypothetical protein
MDEQINQTKPNIYQNLEMKQIGGGISTATYKIVIML